MVRKSVRKTQGGGKSRSSLFGLLAVIGVAATIIVLLLTVKTTPSKTNAERFAEEYRYLEPNETNLFVYKTAAEVKRIFEHGTGVVFLGFPECDWCQAYAPMLNGLARAYEVEEISYYNIRDDRENDTEFYRWLVEKLDGHLQYDNAGNPRIYVPNVAFVVDGEIIGNDYETSKDTLGYKTPEDYWSSVERVEAWSDRMRPLFEQIRASEGCATTCNK